MQAIGKFILIETIKEEEVSNSGLLLGAKDAQELRYKKAKVISRGTDVTSVKNGDTVYVDKVQGNKIVVNGVSYVAIREADVVVVV